MILITLVVSQGYLSTNYIGCFPGPVAWGNKVEIMHGITLTRCNYDDEGIFTHTVSVPVFVTVKVYYCANGDGMFDGQNGF